MANARAIALQAIYAAGLDPALWQAAMDAVSAAAPGVRSHMMHADTAEGAPQRSVVSGYDPAFLQLWDAYYQGINAWAAGFVSGPIGQPRYSAWMCDDDTLKRTEFYADWVRPQDDLIGGGGVVLRRTATQMTLFGGNIPARIRDRMDAQWQHDLALFGPAIRFALDANAAMLSLSIDVLLAHDLNLTATEAQIALALADGKTLAEIAEARRVSVHTVRKQVKSALVKTGARRQADLVALVERLRR